MNKHTPAAYLVEYENGEKEVRFQPNGWGDKVTPLYTHPVDDTALLRQALEALLFAQSGLGHPNNIGSGWHTIATLRARLDIKQQGD